MLTHQVKIVLSSLNSHVWPSYVWRRDEKCSALL